MSSVQTLIVYAFLSVTLALAIRLAGFWITYNIALAMESVHIVIDVVITLFVLVAIWLTKASFAKRLSYGLFKLEDLVSFFIALLIIYFAFDFLLSSGSVLASMSFVAAIFELASLVPLFLAGYTKSLAGSLLRSPSLKADGKHTYTDVYEGMGVGIGLLLFAFSHLVDFYYLAILIAFFTLLYTAYSIGKDSLFSLLDLPKDKRVGKEIEEIASSVEGVKQVKEVRIRWAGPVIFVEIVVEMEPYLTIDESHPLTEVIESKIKEKIEGVSSVVVHVEPVERKEFTLLVPVESANKHSSISKVLGKSKIFAIVKLSRHEKEFEEQTKFIENPFAAKEHIGPSFRDLIAKEGVTDVICANAGEGVYGVICSRRLFCWQATSSSLEDNVEKFKAKKLRKFVFNP
ncbi:MAG: cation diffusion facilitator family transporter [Candidatus Micrarchaeia archaeon]